MVTSLLLVVCVLLAAILKEVWRLCRLLEPGDLIASTMEPIDQGAEREVFAQAVSDAVIRRMSAVSYRLATTTANMWSESEQRERTSRTCTCSYVASGASGWCAIHGMPEQP